MSFSKKFCSSRFGIAISIRENKNKAAKGRERTEKTG